MNHQPKENPAAPWPQIKTPNGTTVARSSKIQSSSLFKQNRDNEPHHLITSLLKHGVKNSNAFTVGSVVAIVLYRWVAWRVWTYLKALLTPPLTLKTVRSSQIGDIVRLGFTPAVPLSHYIPTSHDLRDVNLKYRKFSSINKPQASSRIRSLAALALHSCYA